MEKDVLGEVIEVEKDIQKSIEQEKAKSLGLIEKARRECEEQAAREEQKLRESIGAAVEEAAREGGRKAALILKNADEEAERIRGLKDEFLTRIIIRHIPRILPE